MCKILMIILGVAIATPAFGQGSMAPEVRVVIVKPSRTIQLHNQIYEQKQQIKRAARRAEYQRDRTIQDGIRAKKQAKVLADKAYEKKLKCQKSFCTQK